MTYEQEKHLSDIIVRFSRETDAKYRKGQAEHGGNLVKKPGIVKMLREEALDTVTYTDVLREQLGTVAAVLGRAVQSIKDEAEFSVTEDLVRRARNMVEALLDETPEATSVEG